MPENNETEIEIISVFDTPSTEEGRQGKFDRLITYQTGDRAVYMTKIPREKLEGKGDEEQEKIIAEKIRKELEGRERWKGRKITI